MDHQHLNMTDNLLQKDCLHWQIISGGVAGGAGGPHPYNRKDLQS